jgi:acyl-CoA thioesterase I
MTTLYTFGDSILDCGRFNEHGVTPGALIVRNDDALFPEFQGRDLSSRGPARLEHRAYDGSIVRDLPGQARHLAFTEPAIALVTVGGNDLLHGLVIDQGPGIEEFARVLDSFLAALPIRPVLVGNVYDPTLGEDARNFLGIDPAVARAGLDRMNQAIAAVAARHGTLVDLHAHFLGGDPSRFVKILEPSLRGASEVRRCVLDSILGVQRATNQKIAFLTPDPQPEGAP